MIKEIKKMLLNHPVLSWGIVSVIFTVVIHIAFSLPSINNFFVAKWGAGELLAYSSTVAIGLLAFWQNKRFKQENDISQKKFEELTAQTNTLSIIGKIIEIENENLRNLKSSIDNLTSVCEPSRIIDRLNEALNTGKARTIIISETISQIEEATWLLLRELKYEPEELQKHTDDFTTTTMTYINKVQDFVNHLNGDYSNDFLSSELSYLNISKVCFLTQQSNLVKSKEKKLSSVIYGNLTLDKIKQMYYQEYSTGEKM